MITLKQIDSAIQSFSTDAAAMNIRAHDILVMILLHGAPKDSHDDAEGNGVDIDRVKAMALAMPKSWRRLCMVQWWHTFTPIRIKITKDEIKAGFDAKYEKLKEITDKAERAAARLEWWDVAGAMAKPFFEIAEEEAETEPKKFDLEALMKLLQGQIKKIEKNEDPTSLEFEAMANVKTGLAVMIGQLTVAKARVEVANADAANADAVNDIAA